MTTLDLHLDCPWVFTKRGKSVCEPGDLQKGGLDAVVMALYLSESLQNELTVLEVNKAIDAQGKFIAEKKVELWRDGITVFAALEGGRLINNSLDRLATLVKEHDIKYLTLTHNKNTAWADSATDRPNLNGLAEFGCNVVRACNRLGVLVDVSHTSDRTAEAALKISDKPVIASHSGVRNLVPHPRNLTDDLMKLIARSGGLVGVPFAKNFIGKMWHKVAEHVDYIVEKIGIDHVAIGSDLDGAVMCVGSETAAQWKTTVECALAARGYSDEDMAKIAGRNAMLLFERMKKV